MFTTLLLAFRFLPPLIASLKKLGSGFVVKKAAGAYRNPLLLRVEFQQRASRTNEECLNLPFVLLLFDHVVGARQK